MFRNSAKAATVLSLALGIPSGIVIAQETLGDGGVFVDLNLGQTLAYSDNVSFPNADGPADFSGQTTIDLSYRTVTRSDRFTFDLDTTLEQGSDDQTLPTSSVARLSYSRIAANARIDLAASYRRNDLDDLQFTFVNPASLDPDAALVDDPIQPEIEVTLDSGVQNIFGANLSYDVGLQDPVQLSLDLTYRDTRYTDVIDPDLNDSTQSVIRAGATFRIDPRIDLTFNASQTRRDVEDDVSTNRIRTAYSLGADLDVTRRLTASLGLTYDETETRTTTGTTNSEGVGLTLGVDLDMPNGTAGLNLASRVGANGRIDSLNLRRAFALRDDADLSLSFGVVSAPGQDLRPTYGLTYDQDFKRSQASISFSQSIGTNDDEDDVLRSTLSANYQRPLSEVSTVRLTASGRNSTVLGVDGEDRSSLTLGMSYNAALPNQSVWSLGANASALSVSEGGVTNDENRFGFDLSYQRPLTRDWNVVSSVGYDQINPENGDSRSATTLSLGITRNFSWRP